MEVSLIYSLLKLPCPLIDNFRAWTKELYFELGILLFNADTQGFSGCLFVLK
jgi:hypothetical protein